MPPSTPYLGDGMSTLYSLLEIFVCRGAASKMLDTLSTGQGSKQKSSKLHKSMNFLLTSL
jgi:hypothetical protein